MCQLPGLGSYYLANTNTLFDKFSPRENLSSLKGKVSDKVWTQLAKARGAHLNAMENIPLFAVAMVRDDRPSSGGD